MLIVLPLVACGGGGPTEQESLQAFAAVTVAMSSAQARAVQSAQGVVPGDLTLNFEGSCTTSGTVAVTGSYSSNGSGSTQAAAFDLTTTFRKCADPQGTLDGELRWTSTLSGSKYTATMGGEIDWTSSQASASCDFNLTLTVDGQAVTYGGSVCGFNVTKLNQQQ
jgi:hypothetical protein